MSGAEPAYVYVLVRRDLSLPRQAVQAAHAAIEATRAGLIPAEGPHPHLVLCHVGSIPSLLAAAARLEPAGIRFRLFHEPNWDNAPTALATEPVRGRARALFRRFPLLTERSLKEHPMSAMNPSHPVDSVNSVASRESSAAIGPTDEAPAAFKGRWGYYPCGYDTWRVLKRLRFLWFRTVRRLAAWERWHRKQPQNRVRWRRVCSGGRPVGWEQLGPWSEPDLPPFMVEEKWGVRVMGHGWVDDLYRQARHPTPEPREVLDAARVEQIVDLHRRLEAWYAELR